MMPGASNKTSYLPGRHMVRPLLFVDVDGVISPFGLAAETHASMDGSLRTNLEGEELIIPSGMPERLQRLERVFECVYATTYEDAASALAGVANIGHWDAVRWLRPSGQAWKWKPLLSYARCRPFAWVDDEISAEVLAAAAKLCSRGHQALPLRTDPSIGLTDQDVHLLEAWAGNL